jgi:hypothetical protein
VSEIKQRIEGYREAKRVSDYQPLPEMSEEEKQESEANWKGVLDRIKEKHGLKKIPAEERFTPEQEIARRNELAEQARKVGE